MEDQKGALETTLQRLVEKRNAISSKIETAAAGARSAELKKGALVDEIKKKKEARGRLAGEARALAAKLRSLYADAEKIGLAAPSNRLKKELDNLEWAFQTHAGTYAGEMRMWMEMGRLDSMLRKAMERDGILKEAKEMLQQTDALRRMHDQKHAEVISLSKEWELQDAELRKNKSRIAELRKEREAASENMRAAKRELDAIRSKERSERDAERMMRKKAEKERAEEEKALLDKKAQEVLEKLRSGKKLTGDDLFIVQKANLLEK